METGGGSWLTRRKQESDCTWGAVLEGTPEGVWFIPSLEGMSGSGGGGKDRSTLPPGTHITSPVPACPCRPIRLCSSQGAPPFCRELASFWSLSSLLGREAAPHLSVRFPWGCTQGSRPLLIPSNVRKKAARIHAAQAFGRVRAGVISDQLRLTSAYFALRRIPSKDPCSLCGPPKAWLFSR